MSNVVKPSWLHNLKDKPVVDPREFGAKCNGTDNDTAAIAAAMASFPPSSGSDPYFVAGGGTLLMPVGLCKADVLIPTGVMVQGVGNGASFLATGTNRSVVATVPGSFACGMRDMDIQLDQKTGIVGLDVNSITRGEFSNIMIAGGATLTNGKGLLLRGSATGQCAYVNFKDIRIDIGPGTGLHVEGYDLNHAVTWCSFSNFRISNSNTALPVVNIAGWTDTMFMNNINVVSESAIGMVFNSLNPTVDIDVSGWIIHDLTFESITTTCIQFANCSYITIDGFNNLNAAAANFTKTATSIGVTVEKQFKSPGTLGPTYFNSTSPFQIGTSEFPTGFSTPDFPTTLGTNNNNVDATNKSVLYCIGPSGAFNITGFAGGVRGQQLKVITAVNQPCTIKHNSGSSSAGNRISTLSGSDVTGRTGYASFDFFYSLTDNIWLLTGSNAV